MAELEHKRLEVCLLNHPEAVGVQGDLRETWTEVVEIYKNKTNSAPLSLLAACPPCQGMSSARGLRGQHHDADAGSKDKRNLLAVVIAKVATELKPEIIVLENVPEFLAKKVRHPESNEPVTAANLLIELLIGEYKAFPIILDMCDFGVPQTRKRTFLTFIRRDSKALSKLLNEGTAPFPMPITSDPISVFDALQTINLPPLDSSSIELSKSHVGEGLHRVPILSPERYEMIAYIPPHSGMSAWQNDICKYCGNTNTEKDVYCTNCGEKLLKPIIKDGNNVRLIKGFKTSYKRMASNKPASTVLTTSGSIGGHNTIHPYENRVLSTLECSHLQTLGDDFIWGDALKKWGETNIRAMIGEAVPPLFTNLHGNILIDLLSNKSKLQRLSINDSRCKIATYRLRKNR